MKGGTVKSNKGKKSFHAAAQGKSFGSNQGGGWQGGMAKKSVLTQIHAIKNDSQEDKKEK